MKKKINPSKYTAITRFYSDSLNNIYVDKVHLDEKIHWLLGITTVIMGLSLPALKEGFTLQNSGFLTIFFVSAISFLIALLTLETPEIFRKYPHSDKSFMYYKSHKHMHPDDFAKELKKIITIEQIADQYAYNISNIVNRNNKLKSDILKIAIYFLFWGIMIGIILAAIFGTGTMPLGAITGA